MSDALTYLMGNRWTKDAEGEFITVEDSHAVPPVSLSVDGKSTQITTTGKNLLNPAEFSTGYINKDQSVGGTSSYKHSGYIPIEDGVAYTLSAETTFAAIWGFIYDEEKNVLVSVSERNQLSVVFNPVENGRYVRVSFGNAQAATVQFEKGSVATIYEPYSGGAASPRPDWPQDITSIDGILLKTCAKNFVPNDDPENPNANYAFNSSRRVVWDSENEGFRLTDSGSGVVMPAHVSRNPRAAFIAPKDGIYTFGADTKYYTSGTDFGFRVDVNGTVINGYGWGSSSTETEWTRHSITRTLSKGDRFAATIYQTCLWRNISVVEGSEDVYQPYSGAKVQDLLPDGYSLRSLPDGTKDELHLSYLRPSDRPGWAWYDRELVKRVDLTILDGSESYGSEGGRYYVRQNNMKRLDDYSQSLLCDYLKPYPRQSYIGGVLYFVSGISGYYHATAYAGQNWFYVAIEKDMTASDTKQWVSEHHISVQYPLATTETIQLDPIELPTMQSGLTNLWSDPSTNLSITYERDRNIVISNMKAVLDDLATS